MNTIAHDLLVRSLELPEAERDAFVMEACGSDAELCAKVRRLLVDAARADSFFGDDNGATLGARDFKETYTEKEGDRVGPYTLRQRIGEGGFGTVWMAEQSAPISRRVALKVIKAGMDTKQVLARFEAERQALAMMEHPNIAKVLDAGATATGRPYFAMELVQGIPITDYCDQAGLGTKARLALFGDVCAAINHAHQKGIIHRDIKPSNVMVTLQGDKPVVKVIDFGIAKATQGKLTEHTLLTGTDQFIGTPAYMSPEQADMSGLDIDTRSDIYALGILLYELLAGQPPFDAKSLVSAGYEEMRRIIREVEPPTPSSRMGAAAGDSQTRQIHPRHIAPDLDWIVMKALEKDRTRRYETANAFALDVQRFLADEPVSAGPPTLVYRLGKFVRRNRRSLLSGAAVAAALLIGLAVAGGIWWDSTVDQSKRVARAMEWIGQAERRLEQGAAADFDDASHFREARELARRAEESLSGIQLADRAGEARRTHLQATIAAEEQARTLVAAIEDAMMLDAYALQAPKADPNAKVAALAAAFSTFGIQPFEGPAAATAAKITAARKDVQDRMVAGLTAWATTLAKTDATQAARLTEIIDLADADPWRRELRRAIQAGDPAALEALAKRPEISEQPTMTVLQLSSALQDEQLADAVEILLRRAHWEAPASFWTNVSLGMALAGTIDRNAGEDIRTQVFDVGGFNVGQTLQGAARETNPVRPEFSEAIGFLRAAVAARPDAGIAWMMLGVTLTAGGHLDEAIATLQQAARHFPERADLEFVLGSALLSRERHAEALPYLMRNAGREPADAWNQFTLGTTLAALGRDDEARTALLQAVKLAAKDQGFSKVSFMGKSSPMTPEVAHLFLAMAQSGRGATDAALASAQLALEANPQSAAAHLLRGMELWKQGETSAAKSAIQSALALQPDLATAHNLLGSALMQEGDFKSAIPFIRRAIELAPDDASAHSNLGACLAKLGNSDEALAALKTAIDLAPGLTLAWTNLGGLHEMQGNHDAAIECFRKIADLDPSDIQNRRNLGMTLWIADKKDDAIATLQQLNDAQAHEWLAGVLAADDRHEEAVAAFQRAIAIDPNRALAHHDLGAIFIKLGRHKESIEPFRTAIRLAPGMASAHNQLGITYLFEGKFEEGTESILRGLQINPDSDAFESAAIGALLATGRIPAASLLHGDCGDPECPLSAMAATEVRIRQVLAKDGPDAPEIKLLLEGMFSGYAASGFSAMMRMIAANQDPRATWESQRAEVEKNLATHTIRILQINKQRDQLPDASEEEVKAFATGILQELKAGADFAKLAEKHSDGWAEGKPQTMAAGDLTPELNTAVLALAEGAFSPDLIEMEHAFVLLKVEARQPGKAVDFEDPNVREVIAQIISDRLRGDWMRRYLAYLQAPGPDLLTARTRSIVGMKLITEGKPDEAIELLAQSEAEETTVLGAEDNETLITSNNLAMAYYNAGRWGEAQEMQSRLLETRRRVSGPEHSETLTLMNNLSLSLRRLGHTEEGLKLAEEMVALRRKVSGPQHPLTLTAINNLSTFYLDAERMEEALKLLEEALPLFRKIKGTEHPDTLIALGNFAMANYRTGRRDEAMEMQKEAIRLRLKINGPDHPDTHLAIFNLAGFYTEAGRFEDLKKLKAEFPALPDIPGAPLPSATPAPPPASPLVALKNAALHVWLGEVASYEVISRQMLATAAKSTNPDEAERVAKLACLRPTNDRTILDAILALARKAVELCQNAPWQQMTLGMAEYRSGNHQAAEATLTAVSGMMDAKTFRPTTLQGTADFYRAMCLFQLGRHDEALTLFSATKAAMRPFPADGKTPLSDHADHDDLVLWLACREASALLHSKGGMASGALRKSGLSAGPEGVTLPLEPVFGGFLVEVQIDSKPLRLLVSTGVSCTMLSPQLAKSLGLEPTDGDVRIGKNFKQLSARQAMPKRISLGGAWVENEPVFIAELPTGIEGVLGAGTLADWDVRIDPAAKRLTLFAAGTAPPLAGDSVVPLNCDVVNPELSQFNPQGFRIVNLTVPVRVGSQSLAATPATSVSCSFQLSNVLMERVAPGALKDAGPAFASGASISSDGMSRRAKLAEFTFGPDTLRGLPMEVVHIAPNATDDRSPGVVGFDVLRHYVMTFRFSSGELRLKPLGTVQELTRNSTAGFSLDFENKVLGMEPDGPAAKAGLQVGDEVLEVQGIPLKTMTPADLAAFKRLPPGTVVKLTFRRANTPQQELQLTLAAE